MHLTVKDVSRILKVPQSTVYRWINEGELPMQCVHEQHYINRAELLEWATVHKMDVGPEIFRDAHGNYYSPIRFTQSLKTGGAHFDVPGHDKVAILRCIVDKLPATDAGEREELFELFMARESIGSTALGKGIAIPHPRRPIVLPVEIATVSVFYLRDPVQFGAADGQPVHTVFALVAPTVQLHLHLLARLSFALQDPQFSETILHRGAFDELLRHARRVEDSFDTMAVETPVLN